MAFADLTPTPAAVRRPPTRPPLSKADELRNLAPNVRHYDRANPGHVAGADPVNAAIAFRLERARRGRHGENDGGSQRWPF